MHQRFFGEARDIAKRQIMEWLAPNVRWAAHPMWYGNREAEPQVPDFLNRYATAIGVDIVDGGDSANPHALLEAALACREHLFPDPIPAWGKGHLGIAAPMWTMASLFRSSKLRSAKADSRWSMTKSTPRADRWMHSPKQYNVK